MGSSRIFSERGEVCQSCGKTIYAKKRSAIQKSKLLERSSTRNNRTRLSKGPTDAYQCPHGNGWHVGRRKAPGFAPGAITARERQYADEDDESTD